MNELTVKLKSVGNPDFQQYAPVSPKDTKQCSTLKEASEICRQYIDKWNLGGCNWVGGQIFIGKKQIAFISYNGRIWKGKENFPNTEIPENIALLSGTELQTALKNL
jgi:hypothetical protein